MATALIRYFRIGCALSFAFATYESFDCQEVLQCYRPLIFSEEPTTLLQTATFVRKRGADETPRPPDANASVFAEGKISYTKYNVERLDEMAVMQAPPEMASAEPGPLVALSARPPTVIARLDQALVVATAAVLVTITVLASCGSLKRCLPQTEALSRADLEELRTAWGPWLLMCSYVAVQVATTDQYIPSLANIEADFATTPEVMGLTLQVNWILKAFSALFMAGLADSFGRKPMLILCSTVACVGCLSCACAPSAGWFVAGRVFQGISEGGEPLFAMVARDMIEDTDERMAYMAANFAILFLTPTLAPALGGLVAYWMNWRVPFIMLTGWTLVNTILLIFAMPETRTVDSFLRNPMKDYRVEVRRVLGDRRLVMLALIQGLSMMVIFSVDVNFSLILSEVFYQDQLNIAIIFALIALFGLGGTLLPDFLSPKLGLVNVLRGAAACALVPIVCGFLVGVYATHIWAPLLASVCTCCLVSVSIVISASALYFQPVKELSGAAAGINTCISMLLSSAGTTVSSIVVQRSADRARGLAYWLAGSMLPFLIVFCPCLRLVPTTEAPFEETTRL